MTGTAAAAMQSLPTVTASAPAKTNLVLHVGSPTADGYHPLETLFVAVDLRETVSVSLDPSLARRGSGVVVTVEPAPGSAYERMVEEGTARLSDIPLNESNLAVRAALAVCAEFGAPVPGLRLHLRKAVPVAGGMGGGSADAAAALVAVNRLLASHLGTRPLTAEDLHRLGAALGADVPFMLLGGAAIGRGTGTELEPVAAGHHLHLVFVPQDQGLSTPAVYRQWDAAHPGPQPAPGHGTAMIPPPVEQPFQDTAALAPVAPEDPGATARLSPVRDVAAAPTPQDRRGTTGGSVSGDGSLPGTISGPPRSGSIQPAGPENSSGIRPADCPGTAPDPVPAELLETLAHGDARRLAPLVRNDLQAPAIHLLPELGTLLPHGLELGAVVGWVSGSGPTLCFLAGSAEEAQTLVAAFGRERRRALAVTAPAPGARVESAG